MQASDGVLPANVMRSFSMLLRCSVIFAPLGLSGCGLTAQELEQATDPLADSIPNMLTAQIAHNLMLRDENPDAIPAQIAIVGGSSQVSNQLILPTAGLSTIGRLFSTFSLQNQNQWQQGWSVTPVTNVGDLQRLDALYRYAWREDTLCQFVTQYTEATIDAPGSPVMRLSDFGDNADKGITNKRLQDFNAPDPTDSKLYVRDIKTLPQTEFGPPADLPLPPYSVVKACSYPGNKDESFVGTGLAPDKWAVPFPSNGDFIWIANTGHPWTLPPPPPNSPEEREGRHDLKQMYVNKVNYARFQMWVLGATINTTSSGKGGGSSPSKGISGSNG